MQACEAPKIFTWKQDKNRITVENSKIKNKYEQTEVHDQIQRFKCHIIIAMEQFCY